MKISKIRVLALSLIATIGSLDAMAQEPTRFTVPFGFVVGAQTFPAGKYRVGELKPQVLQIQSEDGRLNGMVLTHPAEPGKRPGIAILTFQRYGDSYFLSKVSDNNHGWGLSKSAREKELIAGQARPKPLDIVASSRR